MNKDISKLQKQINRMLARLDKLTAAETLKLGKQIEEMLELCQQQMDKAGKTLKLATERVDKVEDLLNRFEGHAAVMENFIIKNNLHNQFAVYLEEAKAAQGSQKNRPKLSLVK